MSITPAQASFALSAFGDGIVVDLESQLQTLEPPLTIAGRAGGSSGPDGMALAVEALRKSMDELGCEEWVAPR